MKNTGHYLGHRLNQIRLIAFSKACHENRLTPSGSAFAVSLLPQEVACCEQATPPAASPVKSQPEVEWKTFIEGHEPPYWDAKMTWPFQTPFEKDEPSPKEMT